jgi:hypothetical protein
VPERAPDLRGLLIAGFALRSVRKGADAFAQAIKETIEAS